MRPPASANSLSPYMDGSRFFCAKLAIRARFRNATEDEATVNASARPVVNVENARSKSSGRFTSTDWSCRCRERAALSVSLYSSTAPRTSGFHTIATRESPGTASFRSSSRLALSSGEKLLRPVTFPPGRQARDEACPNRIGAVGHHDRNCLSLLLDCRNPWIGGRHDHVHLQAYQLGGDVRQPLGLGLAEPALHNDVLTFQITQLPQTFGERRGEMRRSSRSAWMENPNAGNPRRRLCPGDDRGSEGPKRQRDDESKLSDALHVRQTSPSKICASTSAHSSSRRTFSIL